MRAIPSSPLEAIVPDQRREGFVRLVAGGRTILTVPAETVRAEGLAAGEVLAEEQYGRLEAAADRAAAYRTALRLLERRAYARRDLARRLALKGHQPGHIEEALERAARAGYLDDAQFAARFVESRSARGRGPARLRRELLGMGVARDVVDQALSTETTGSAAVASRIEQLIAKRRQQLSALSGTELRRRIVAYLGRRGYTGSEVVRLVRDRLS
ncbi:MAG: regulatory protein RecX [Gemmatimonadales bacterium]